LAGILKSARTLSVCLAWPITLSPPTIRACPACSLFRSTLGMEVEDHSAQLLQEVFADKSVYEILEVDTKATPEQIKKAYRKLALRYHPDKGGDVKKFQALSIAHAVLSDPEKRRIYDQTGDVDGEDSKDFDDWFAYFRNLFPAITVANIDSFGDRYVGSAEEKKDIVETYGRFKVRRSSIRQQQSTMEVQGGVGVQTQCAGV
jgi:DnaJ-class molecular chaperone